MSRSTKKGPYVDEKLAGKIQAALSSGKRTAIKTWARSCTVIPDFVGAVLQVHNGKKFIEVRLTEQMVGHKIGEFAPTRFFRGHGAAHTKEATATT